MILIADTNRIIAVLAINCGIWSDDEHLQKQNIVKIWRTKELIMFL